jgi:hypothetical protein
MIKWISGWKRKSVKVIKSDQSDQKCQIGPLLFTVYTNDLSTVLLYSKFHSYADDLQIYVHFKVSELNETITRIIHDIDNFVLWAAKNGLKLNPDKTKPIIIGHARLPHRVDMNTAPKLTVDGTCLPYYDKVKSLGLIICNTLDWTDAVVNTCVCDCSHPQKNTRIFKFSHQTTSHQISCLSTFQLLQLCS